MESLKLAGIILTSNEQLLFDMRIESYHALSTWYMECASYDSMDLRGCVGNPEAKRAEEDRVERMKAFTKLRDEEKEIFLLRRVVGGGLGMMSSSDMSSYDASLNSTGASPQPLITATGDRRRNKKEFYTKIVSKTKKYARCQDV